MPPFDFEAHRQRMVSHFLELEKLDPVYARWALVSYCTTPGTPFPKLHLDVVAEKKRREAGSTPSSSGSL